MADGPDAPVRQGLLAELKRQRVVRVLVLYAVVGWIVIEVASVVLPALNLPQWSVTLVIVLVALGFPIALALAWAGDAAPGGLQPPSPRRLTFRRQWRAASTLSCNARNPSRNAHRNRAAPSPCCRSST